jgi:hypothetical protein
MAWKTTAELATSALPDAPIRAEAWPPSRHLARRLRG